jgi:glutamate-1-semialdehyde 2,1-aminomutase
MNVAQDYQAESWARRARAVLPRGVTSVARIRSNGPLFVGGSGAVLHGADGREYLDMIMASGPLLLGHDRPEVLEAVRAQLVNGVLYGNHPAEIELAERITEIIPHARKVALANSGSEATHLAVRIARATTGRPLVLKFEGHYHGWLDPLFCNNQSVEPDRDLTRRPAPRHAVPGLAADGSVLICRYNEIGELEQVFAEHGDQIGAVILEPIPMNFGTFLPVPGFVERLRELSTRHGSLLIFDEVLSGFRVGLTGSGGLLGIEPDISVFAKAIANGFGLAAVVGTDHAMSSITDGGVYPAGTYSGGPVGCAAALATLEILSGLTEHVYGGLDRGGAHLAAGLRRAAADLGAPLTVHQIGSVLQLFWGVDSEIRSFADAMTSDRATIARICEDALSDGVFVAPRGLMLLSAAHTTELLDRAIAALSASMAKVVSA